MKKIKIVVLVIFTMVLNTISLRAQKVEVRDIDGAKYAVIVASDGAPKGTEVRNDVDLYYNDVHLYIFDGTALPSPGGNTVKKIVRHNQTGNSYYSNGTSWVSKTYNPNHKVSASFAISPTDVWSDGGTAQNAYPSGNPLRNTVVMNWATAAGWLANANEVAIADGEVSALNTGCYMYQGKNGTDLVGTWRLPTQRELLLMWILRTALPNTNSHTAFASFTPTSYWSATESSATNSWYVNFSFGTTATNGKIYTFRVRCVRDVTP